MSLIQGPDQDRLFRLELLDRSSWGDERVIREIASSELRAYEKSSWQRGLLKTASSMLSVAMVVGTTFCALAPVILSSLYYLIFVGIAGYFLLYQIRKRIDSRLWVQERVAAVYHNGLSLFEKRGSLKLPSVGDLPESEKRGELRTDQTVNADYPEKRRRSVRWMAEVADRHHLDEYYLMKWIVANELAAAEEGAPALKLMKKYVESIFSGDPTAQYTAWEEIEEQVLAEIGSCQPIYSASSWQALKEAVASQKAALLAQKLQLQLEKGQLVERQDYEALLPAIVRAEKRVNKRISITRKNDRIKLKNLELSKRYIEEQSPHYPLLHKLDEIYSLLQKIGESGDLSYTGHVYIYYIEEFKKAEASVRESKCSELEKLYGAIKAFDPTLKKEELTHEDVKEVARELWYRGRRLVGGLQVETVPSDPISLPHHVKELRVNCQLKRVDKQLHRVNVLHKAGIEWLAVSVLLIVESIFFAYPAVSIGVSAGVIAAVASGAIFQKYFVNLDRKKLALKMERRSYRQLNLEIGRVPGHPKALQELKRVTEKWGLDSMQGTKASLLVGRAIPDYEKRTRRMVAWIPLKSLRQRLNKALYRDIYREPMTYSNELKQVRALLVQRLKEDIWSVPASMEEVTRLYVYQQNLQRKKSALEDENKKLETPLASKLENQQILRSIDEKLSELQKKNNWAALAWALMFVENHAKEEPLLEAEEIDELKSIAAPAKEHLEKVRNSGLFQTWKTKQDEYRTLLEEAEKIKAEQNEIWPYQEALFTNTLELTRISHETRLKNRVNHFAMQMRDALKCAKLAKEKGEDYSDKKLVELNFQFQCALKLFEKEKKRHEIVVKKEPNFEIGEAVAEDQRILSKKLLELSGQLLTEYRELQRVLKEKVQQPLTNQRNNLMSCARRARQKLAELEKKIPKQKSQVQTFDVLEGERTPHQN